MSDEPFDPFGEGARLWQETDDDMGFVREVEEESRMGQHPVFIDQRQDEILFAARGWHAQNCRPARIGRQYVNCGMRRGEPVQRRKIRANPLEDTRANVRTVSAFAMESATCPARTDDPPTSRDRNRSMMPPVMSVVTLTAVIEAPNPAHSSSTPGTT